MTDSKKLRRIAEELLILAEKSGPSKSNSVFDLFESNVDSIDPDHLTRFAQALYKTRRVRARHFDENIFGEPAWDMLLDLYVHNNSANRTSVKSLCLASHVPETTALRWIGLLVDAALVIRESDESDRRRVFLSLTPSGEAAIRRYLIEVTKLLRPVRLPTLMLSGAGT